MRAAIGEARRCLDAVFRGGWRQTSLALGAACIPAKGWTTSCSIYPEQRLQVPVANVLPETFSRGPAFEKVSEHWPHQPPLYRPQGLIPALQRELAMPLATESQERQFRSLSEATSGVLKCRETQHQRKNAKDRINAVMRCTDDRIALITLNLIAIVHEPIEPTLTFHETFS